MQKGSIHILELLKNPIRDKSWSAKLAESKLPSSFAQTDILPLPIVILSSFQMHAIVLRLPWTTVSSTAILPSLTVIILFLCQRQLLSSPAKERTAYKRRASGRVLCLAYLIRWRYEAVAMSSAVQHCNIGARYL